MVILTLFMALNNVLYSQRNIELSTGIGLPDYMNIKIKYGSRFQIGAGIGTYPASWNHNFMGRHLTSILHNEFPGNIITLALDGYYHFEQSKYPNLFNWYWNFGIAHASINPPTVSQQFKEEISLYYLRYGSSLYFSDRAGVNIDLGMMLEKSRYTKFGSWGGQEASELDIIPLAGSISLFYRF